MSPPLLANGFCHRLERNAADVSVGSVEWSSHPAVNTDSSWEAPTGQARATKPPNDTALSLLAWVVLLPGEFVPAIALAMLIPADNLRLRIEQAVLPYCSGRDLTCAAPFGVWNDARL